MYKVRSLIDTIKLDTKASIHVDINALFNALIEYGICFQTFKSKHYNPKRKSTLN